MSHGRSRVVLTIVDQDSVSEEIVVVGDSDIVGHDDASGPSDADNSPSDKSIGRNLPNLYHRGLMTYGDTRRSSIATFGW